MAELSPLRRRMIEDMTVRNYATATQRSYISAVSKFSRYIGRSPDQLSWKTFALSRREIACKRFCRSKYQKEGFPRA